MANMNGWDVVSLVTIPFVNTAIQIQGNSPTSMQVANGIIDATASFGTWQITVGGSDNIIMFNIPLNRITGLVIKSGQIIEQFDYQQLSARVQLVLTFIDKNLVVDSQSPPTSIVSLVDQNGQSLSNLVDDAFIKEALVIWFGQNLSQFSHVFASIDLDPSTASDAQWAFCKPAIAAYTFVAGNNLSNSYLGLTYNTAGNTKPGSAVQIDPSFIPPHSQAAFMLSPAMFLNNFVAPATRLHFRLQQGQLSVDTNQMTAALVGRRVPLPPISDRGKHYQPFLQNLQIAVQNSVITMYGSTSTVVLDEWYGTVTAYNESYNWVTIGLDGSKQSLVYSNARAPINNHHTEASESFTIIQTVLEVVGIVALVIATILTDGADLLVVSALAGVASGGLMWAMAEIEEGGLNEAPGVGNLVSNIALPVQWTGTGPFKVSQAGLYQGGFFLAGTLQPSAQQKLSNMIESQRKVIRSIARPVGEPGEI